DIWESASIEIELEAIGYDRSQATLRAYLPYLPKDVPILEAGSGLSAVVITLRQMGYRIQGLDYAINALRTSRRHDGALALVNGDVHALPYAENSLGAYLSFGVLEHFEHGMQPALIEAFRVLMPKGVLILTIPYPNVVNGLVGWRRKQAGIGRLNDDDFYESTYTRDRLTSEVKQAGFHIEQVLPTSHSYTLWGLGGVFRAPGYYRTSKLADRLGDLLKVVTPWAFNFSTLVIARKP
ncbi:MAG: class I SAM-dependent methyltransferase, partial [Anaerolineae bacterium]|nr:class I SAM-dependent methyltransferase [Anaerolineae bacterium]